MTANAFSEDIQHSLAAGMNAHVSKPVEMKVLEKTIRSIKSGGGGYRTAGYGTVTNGFDAAVQFYLSSRRLPLLQVVSNNKSFSVGVQSPTEINAPRGHTLSSGQWFCADRNEV